jgi:hypothetical protein
MITQSKKLRTIKCWGCGQGHSLRGCATTSDGKKQNIFLKKGGLNKQQVDADQPGEQCQNKYRHRSRFQHRSACGKIYHHLATETYQVTMEKHTNASTTNEPYSLIGDWMIYSDCTIHMTPYIEDFISDCHPTKLW